MTDPEIRAAALIAAATVVTYNAGGLRDVQPGAVIAAAGKFEEYIRDGKK